MIFSTVFGPHEPALTVGSLAIRQTGPAVDRGHAGDHAVGAEALLLPVARAAPSSTNESGSTSRSTRSRTGSLPCSSDFSWWRAGPPARARSRASLEIRLDSLRVHHRLVARVVVEALAGLAPVPAGGQHLAQRRRLGEAALAELVEHHVADRAHGVEAHEVGERERAHRVPGAGLHRLVDLGDRADPLLVGADRVEHVRHEQAVDDEARLVLGRHAELAVLSRELHAGLERLVGGGHAADDLHELHHLGGVEVVQAEEALRPRGGRGLVDHRQRRGVGGEDGAVLDDGVDLLPHLELLAEVLGDRLDHEVAVGRGRSSRACPGSGRGRRRRRPARACPSRPRARAASRSCPVPCRASPGRPRAARRRSRTAPPPGRFRGPSGPQPSTPTFLISIASSQSVQSSSAGSLYVTRRDRGSRSGPPRRPAASGEAQRVQRGADPGAGPRTRGGRGRRRRPMRGRVAATARCSPPGWTSTTCASCPRPERPARLPPPDPGLVEPARGDAQAHDLPDPRCVPRRRVRAGAGGRLQGDGRGRRGRDHGGARGAASRRGRLLAPARRSSASATPRS